MPYRISEMEALLWDFDGVILDSMEVRDFGFIEIFKDFPQNQIDELLAFHNENGGLSRYVKIEHFFKEIAKVDYTKEDISRFAGRFSVIMKQKLTDPENLILDSVDFIRDYYQEIPFHIVSGSDQTELRYLCEELNISSYFVSIHGSPTPKIELVDHLIKSYKYNKNELALIGDSINDYEAAQKNGIDFIGYNNHNLKEKGTYISSLRELERI